MDCHLLEGNRNRSSNLCDVWLSQKDYVAVSIDICPWQDPMQLGIK